MTTAEIKALLEEAHDDVRRYECPKYSTSCKMMTALETLLARQAEMVKIIGKGATTATEAWWMVDVIRAAHDHARSKE